MSIYLLMLSDRDISDNRINDLLAKVPDRNVLLLEDIDCAFAQRKRTNGKEGGLTFSEYGMSMAWPRRKDESS